MQKDILKSGNNLNIVRFAVGIFDYKIIHKNPIIVLLNQFQSICDHFYV